MLWNVVVNLQVTQNAIWFYMLIIIIIIISLLIFILRTFFSSFVQNTHQFNQ